MNVNASYKHMFLFKLEKVKSTSMEYGGVGLFVSSKSDDLRHCCIFFNAVIYSTTIYRESISCGDSDH